MCEFVNYLLLSKLFVKQSAQSIYPSQTCSNTSPLSLLCASSASPARSHGFLIRQSDSGYLDQGACTLCDDNSQVGPF